MKSISTQLDTLVDLLKKNISNKELLQSKDNFDMVYYKITQQAFKSINVLVQNFTDDLALKLSYSSLLNQLKTFLSLKPETDDDQQEQYYAREFDEVQQFMNNRKPVMPDMDAGQRGDIYKFLYQAENKSKDIQEFMGNVNKFNPKTNKKFQLTNHKWKKTLKHLPIITQDIQTQTNINLQFFVCLQKKLPNIFAIPSNQSKNTHENILNNKQNDQQFILDIESQIQKIINEKMEQKVKAIEEKKTMEQKELKQKQNEQKKKQTDKKKKKPSQSNNKRNSEANLQRNSLQPSSVKAKSQFNSSKKQTQPNQSLQKPLPSPIVQQMPNIQNSTVNRQNNNINEILCSSSKEKDRMQQSKKMKEILPSFQSFLQTISLTNNLSGVTQEQIKKIYELLKTQISLKMVNDPIKKDNRTLDYQVSNEAYNDQVTSKERDLIIDAKQTILKKKTSQKQVNTQISYLNQAQKQRNNGLKLGNSRSKFFSKESNISQQNNSKIFNEINGQAQTQKRQRQMVGQQKNKNLKHTQGSDSIQDYKNQKYHNLSSQLNQTQFKNQPDSFKQKSNLNSNAHLKNSLPQLSKPAHIEILYKLQRNNSMDSLVKEGQLTQMYLKRLNETKQPISPQNTKLFNKENYTLDMYKSKQFPSRNRASEHINLPSLNRKTIKPHISLHQQIDQSKKNHLLKKIGKKNTVHQSFIDPSNFVNQSQQCQNQGNLRRSISKNQLKELKEEQRILNELTKISNQGSVKMNLKNIVMYVNRVESIHFKRCGEKCIHLERFYGFLQRNNIPNRKELSMHKADMNSSVNI